MRTDKKPIEQELRQVCETFRIQGTFQSFEEIKVGNVNHTYKVNYIRNDGKPKSYIVQRVNTYVFRNPVQVMDNIDLVTEHIHARAPKKRSLHFHHTADRKTYAFIENGFWRLFNYIPSNTYNITDNPHIICNAGKRSGSFKCSCRTLMPGGYTRQSRTFITRRSGTKSLLRMRRQIP